MLGMLTAIPKTPLYDRLASRGAARPVRTSRRSAPTSIPLRLDRGQLRDGYVRLLSELNEPDAYFARLEDLYPRWPAGLQPGGEPALAAASVAAGSGQGPVPGPGARPAGPAGSGESPTRPCGASTSGGSGGSSGPGRDPSVLWIYVVKCAMHYHADQMAREMDEGRTAVINSF